MKKYREVVELIKADYSNFGFDRHKNENNVKGISSEANSEFEISSKTSEIKKMIRVTEYSIVDNHTDKKWRALVGPAMILFSERLKNYRSELLKNEKVRGIFTIKSGFFEKTSIPLAVILLGKEKGKIWLSSVTTSDDVVSLISSPKHFKRKVYFTDLLDVENFLPEHYNGELQKINKELDKKDTRKLGEIAEIRLGKSIPSSELCDSGISYVRGRDIQNGQLEKSDVFISEKDIEKYAKQLLQEGDILLSRYFGQHKIAKVVIDDLPAIASNGLYIIRAYGVPEGYLYEYLTSETGKAIFDKQLSNIEKGTIVTSINLKDLVELRVPVFEEWVMNSMAMVESIKVDEFIGNTPEESMHRLTVYADRILQSQEKEIERKILNEFIEFGWSKEEVKQSETEDIIDLPNNKRWRSDIVLFDGRKRLAMVEVKTNFFQFTKEMLDTLYLVIQSGEIPFLILATGNYYEIHSTNNKIVDKRIKPPTKDYLLSLLRERRLD